MNGIFGFGREKNGALTNVPRSLLRNCTQTEAETLAKQAAVAGVPRSVYNGVFFNGGELNRAVELLTLGHRNDSTRYCSIDLNSKYNQGARKLSIHSA